ncbi:MAG TPA: DUF520 family protein [Thermodesulfovibrionales bacterium]|nr:DUF520 family protein [Thermodesulfovibrionales bacterium]
MFGGQVEMVKLIKDLKLKVNAEIQKDQVRVRAKKNRRSPDDYGQTEGRRLRDTSPVHELQIVAAKQSLFSPLPFLISV